MNKVRDKVSNLEERRAATINVVDKAAKPVGYIRPRMARLLASMPPHPRVLRSCCDLVVL